MTDGAPMDQEGAGVPGVAASRHHHTCRHQWRFVSDEVDEFGRVRMFECRRCDDVHFT